MKSRPGKPKSGQGCKAQVSPRNLVVRDSALLRKGGVHQKSHKRERQRDKIALKRSTFEQAAIALAAACSNAERGSDRRECVA